MHWESHVTRSLVYIFDLVSGASELLDLWLLENVAPANHAEKQQHLDISDQLQSFPRHASGFERLRTDPGSALLEGTSTRVHVETWKSSS